MGYTPGMAANDKPKRDTNKPDTDQELDELLLQQGEIVESRGEVEAEAAAAMRRIWAEK
jgi:hypothetical protein